MARFSTLNIVVFSVFLHVSRTQPINKSSNLTNSNDNYYYWFNILTDFADIDSQLVLDIDHDTIYCPNADVILCSNDPGKPSQIWRWEGQMLKNYQNEMVMKTTNASIKMSRPTSRDNQAFNRIDNDHHIYLNNHPTYSMEVICGADGKAHNGSRVRGGLTAAKSNCTADNKKFKLAGILNPNFLHPSVSNWSTQEDVQWFNIVTELDVGNCLTAVHLDESTIKPIICPWDYSKPQQVWRWDGRMIRNKGTGQAWKQEGRTVVVGDPGNDADSNFYTISNDKHLYAYNSKRQLALQINKGRPIIGQNLILTSPAVDVNQYFKISYDGLNTC